MDAAFSLSALSSASVTAQGSRLFPSLSLAFMPWNHLGFGGEIAWGRNNYVDCCGDQFHYTPVYYDIDAVFAPFGDKRNLVPEAEVGLGGESIP